MLVKRLIKEDPMGKRLLGIIIWEVCVKKEVENIELDTRWRESAEDKV